MGVKINKIDIRCREKPKPVITRLCDNFHTGAFRDCFSVSVIVAFYLFV